MLGKVIDILKDNPFYILSILLKKYRNLNINLLNLIILI